MDIANICALSDKPIVLMIDEVDSATNNQMFLEFLAKLRGLYIDMSFSADDIATMLSEYEQDHVN